MAENRTFLGKGFTFPPAVDPVTGRFLMASEDEDIRQAIYLILMTGVGERPMEPDFGCDATDYVFDLPEARAKHAMEDSVYSALLRWEPRIDNISVEVQDRGANGTVYIGISYTVRSTNNPVNLVFPYYLDTGFGRWRQVE
ncbi:MAG: GPW/gp25 family protein [Lachnospiraceae bacterium]|nr:GPW/gp25 family protein [Lachnospiraceae bacterium]